MNLEAHDITRTELGKQVGLLLGNGEMGGLLRNDGLGFDELWFSDLWSEPSRRAPIRGFRLKPEGAEVTATDGYRQHLSLREGILTTDLRSGGQGYRSVVFFPQVERHHLRIRLTNTAAARRRWTVVFPADPVSVEKLSDSATLVFEAAADYMALPFTRVTWTLLSNRPFRGREGDRTTVVLDPGESLDLTCVITTSFDAKDAHSKALKSAHQGFAPALRRHTAAWRALWERFDIELPAGDYADVFYRSLYYSFCVTGNERFLPGECQFSEPAWGMQPFTSGTPTWGAMLMASINHEERARDLLQKLYTPQTLRENAGMYLMLLGGRNRCEEFGAPYSFAHQIDIAGRESCFPYGTQRHIDGLMPATFHQVSRRFDVRRTADTITYDVLRGCAVFWLGMLKWDASRRTCTILPTLGLDEILTKPSSLVSVIACAWTLMMFARYAKEAGQDRRLAGACRQACAALHWPHNGRRYLDFPGDPERGAGYSARSSQYNCVRSFSTFAFPYNELTRVLDRPRTLRTLDAYYDRVRFGEGDIEHQRARSNIPGFNSYTANWYALTETYLKRPDRAYDLSNLCVRYRMDPSGVAMSEGYNYRFFYLATGYMNFALVTLSMLLQSYNDTILPFAAMPKALRTVSFRNLPAERGILVSGSMTDGKVDEVVFEHRGRVLLRTGQARPVAIRVSGDRLSLSEQRQKRKG